jgi:dihydropteroate synthase
MGPIERWALRRGGIALDRPCVMGVLNATPDSFSDGGILVDLAAAALRARNLEADGADLLDVGGESTRPGAEPVSVDEECARVVPLLARLRADTDLPLSVDTRRAEVAREALAAGADVVNDVSGLGDPAMGSVVAAAGAGLVLMHMRGTPRTMAEHARYDDVVAEVAAELRDALARSDAAGIHRDSVVVDPGLGFAKTADQSLALIAGIPRLRAALGRPVLLGPSRKSFLADLVGGAAPAGRDAGTAGACVAGLSRGARLFRVHDARTARHALDVAHAILFRREGA